MLGDERRKIPSNMDESLRDAENLRYHTSVWAVLTVIKMVGTTPFCKAMGTSISLRYMCVVKNKQRNFFNAESPAPHVSLR